MTQIKRAKAILRNYHALEARKYVGDLDAICTLVDLERAIAKAELTARQAEALRLVFIEDLTQKSAGKRMRISQQAVDLSVKSGLKRIDDVLEAWAWMEDEISVADFENESEAV